MNQLTTILDWIRFAITAFSQPENESKITYGQGCLNAYDESHALVLGLLSLPFDLDKSYFLATLTNEEIEKVKSGINTRIEQQLPTAYITHRAMYMGIEFYVDERVLIPRSAIFELISKEFSPYLLSPPEMVLDLCCGSGCIGIATSYMLPHSQIIVSDIDEGAVEVANINIDKHDMGSYVTAIQSDLFENLLGYKFDLIISNPPYVDEETMCHLPAEFSAEPSLALGSGELGLDVTLQIFKQALEFLNPNGLLVLEVGDSFDLLEQTLPEISFNWHEFETGGCGVLIMTYQELEVVSQTMQ